MIISISISSFLIWTDCNVGQHKKRIILTLGIRITKDKPYT